MRRLLLLCLTFILVAFAVPIAHAQDSCAPTTATGDAQNEMACNQYGNFGACTIGCGSNLFLSCPCFWDDQTNPNGFPVDMAFGTGNGTNCTPETPCCWNRPCSTFGDDAACAIGGGGRVVDGEDLIVEDRCHWFADEGRCGCAPPLETVPPCGDPVPVSYAPFDCYLPVDHFTFYKVKPSKGADKFVRFGSVLLREQFRYGDVSPYVPFQVSKPARLGLPANKNAEGVRDATTHSEEYLVKPVKGGPPFPTRSDVHVVNQCNDVVLEVAKPVSLLVPTAQSQMGPVVKPAPVNFTLKNFLCHQAKPQAKLADGTPLPKFPRGIQVDVADEFQTRRYDLVKITKLCAPVEVSGSPTLLSGPAKGTPKPITPANLWSPVEHLVCYRARLAKNFIAQTGCGPTTPGDRGTPIVPAQAKHAPITGLHVANDFGAERLDTVQEAEFCIPSSVAAM